MNVIVIIRDRKAPKRPRARACVGGEGGGGGGGEGGGGGGGGGEAAARNNVGAIRDYDPAIRATTTRPRAILRG